MFSLLGKSCRLCDGLSRREWLRVGGLGIFGLSLADVLRAGEADPTEPPPNDKMFGRAKNVIFLYLSGGPPQHETFDPKPHASAEVRGPYKPISTNVPGIHFCELLPRTAAVADRLAVIRSMYTNNDIHGASSHWVITGRKPTIETTENALPTDWPNVASIVKMFRPSETLPALTAVTIPEMRIGNAGNQGPAQAAGFLGQQWSPEFITCDPSHVDFQMGGLFSSRVAAQRLQDRSLLLNSIGPTIRPKDHAVAEFQHYQRQALDLLTSGRARQVFAIEREPSRVRERYGMHHWGQSVLLARRLVEAGVRFVTVNWPREPGDRGTDNPLWDTHARNFDRMEDVLAPQFDVGFTALLEDLDDRGLLDETLVLAVGEFGRTPKINAKAGRDHWGKVFSCALAGAGISGGQVYGASDRQGAEPAQDPVNPGRLAATIFHLTGINYQGVFPDELARPLPISDEEPLFDLLGASAATEERVTCTGDTQRVPPFNPRKLLATNFAPPAELLAAEAPARRKGWTAAPLIDSGDDDFGVTLAEPGAVSSNGRTVLLGFGLAGGRRPPHVAQGSQAILAQRIASPTAGRYIVRLEAQGTAAAQQYYQRVFLENFRIRLALFQFTDHSQIPLERRELASVEVRPAFRALGSSSFQTFELEKLLANAEFGMNFSFGVGIGVAVIVERSTVGPLSLPSYTGPHQAMLRIKTIDLEFQPKTV